MNKKKKLQDSAKSPNYGGNQVSHRAGLAKSSTTLRTEGLDNAGRLCLDVEVIQNCTIPHNWLLLLHVVPAFHFQLCHISDLLSNLMFVTVHEIPPLHCTKPQPCCCAWLPSSCNAIIAEGGPWDHLFCCRKRFNALKRPLQEHNAKSRSASK